MSPPSSNDTEPTPRRAWWVLGWLVLTLHLISVPREAMDHGLDSSNYGTYATFVAEGRQFGNEVIPMVGPLGFVLYGHTYAGVLFDLRWTLEIVLKGGLAALLLHIFGVVPRRSSAWFWLITAAALTVSVDDMLHDYGILLGGLLMIRSFYGGSLAWSIAAMALLGPLSLMKGTHLVTAGAVVGFAGLVGIYRREYGKLIRQGVVFIASVLLAWMAAGQNPLNLPAYIRGVLELSSGYNAAMGLAPPGVYLITGLVLGIGLFLHGCLTWGSAPPWGPTRAAVVLIAGFAFIKWKHGFLRADGHVFIFFTAVAIFSATLQMLHPGGWLEKTKRPIALFLRGQLALTTLLVAGGILGACAFTPIRIWAFGHFTASSIPLSLQYVFRPSSVHAELEAELSHNRQERELSQVRNSVGRDSIDFYGYEQGVLLLNDLNYQPRPMGGGSFNVFTPWLQKLNEDFVRDPERAPSWQLVKLARLDDRLPAADDGPALRAILGLYSPVLMQRDYLLMKRRQEAPPDTSPAFLGEKAIRPGEPVDVPRVPPDSMVLFSLESRLSTAGRIKKLAVRPPELEIRLELGEAAVPRRYAMKPNLARNPVILSPLLETEQDLLRLWTDHPGHIVKRLTLFAQPGFDEDGFSVRFYSAPKPPSPEKTDINEIIAYNDYPLFNREPIDYQSEETGIRDLNKEEIRIVHAPGSITWELQPKDQQLIFSYGIMPQAYSEGGTSDGVEFNVEILWPDGDGRVLWKRMMRPRRVSDDRGLQRLRVPLPPYTPGSQVRIRTHPGPDNDGAYDQSYVTRFQIKNGPLIGDQFSGLGAVPQNGKLPRDSMAGIGDRFVYLLHAPNEVRIPIPTGATTVSFECGLLPGAYTQDGASDGVEFGVFLQEDGGDLQFLQGWFLNPRDEPADRGPQMRTIELPETSSVERVLVIATNVGPHGNRSWDQSYVAGVRFAEAVESSE